MSIWTFRRGLGFPVLVVASGCTQLPSVTTADLGLNRSALQTVAVAKRTVVIAGPSGYCIDRAGSNLGGDSAFVVLASCGSITGNAQDGAPRAQGLLTASVAKERGPGVLTAPDVLQAYVTSPAGRAAMARDGRAASVTILETVHLDGAFLIRLRDTSQGNIAGVEEVYWRGLTDLNGRLVTLSVVSFTNKPFSSDASLATLRTFLARIRAESPTQVAVN